MPIGSVSHPIGSDVGLNHLGISDELLGKRQNAPTFHCGLSEKMFVSISRHIKNIHGVWKDKKQGVRDENYLVDRNEQHYFF